MSRLALSAQLDGKAANMVVFIVSHVNLGIKDPRGSMFLEHAIW